MADIEVVCRKCKAEIKVSAFVDLASLKCRTCGDTFDKKGQVSPPVSAPSDNTTEPTKEVSSEAKQRKLKIREKEVQQPQQPVSNEPTTWEKTKEIQKKAVQEDLKKQPISQAIKAFAVFLVVGGICGYLRYGKPSFIPADFWQNVKYYQVGVFLVLYVSIILLAFKDTVFAGILCLLVPGYAIYYLLAVADTFYFRAILFGIYIAIGQDSGILIHKFTMDRIKAGQDFINNGGEFKKTK